MRGGGTPPNVEEFAEAFAGYPIYPLVGFLAGYEQAALDPGSRNFMAFDTRFGLIRPTAMVHRIREDRQKDPSRTHENCLDLSR